MTRVRRSTILKQANRHRAGRLSPMSAPGPGCSVSIRPVADTKNLQFGHSEVPLLDNRPVKGLDTHGCAIFAWYPAGPSTARRPRWVNKRDVVAGDGGFAVWGADGLALLGFIAAYRTTHPDCGIAQIVEAAREELGLEWAPWQIQAIQERDAREVFQMGKRRRGAGLKKESGVSRAVLLTPALEELLDEA